MVELNPHLEQTHKLIAAVQFISAAGLILFWLGYFLTPLLGFDGLPVYSAYQNILPWADSGLAVIMIASGLLVLRRTKAGQFLTVLIAFIFIILGLAGFKVELDNGIVLISMVSMLKSGIVNLWCIVFGLFFLLRLKGRRVKPKPG